MKRSPALEGIIQAHRSINRSSSMLRVLKVIFCVSVAFGCSTSSHTLAYREPAQAELSNIVVGIVGDIHENLIAEEAILKEFRSRHVTHIIGTGDFINWGGPTALTEVLKKFSLITSISRENIFLMPGNWEHETGFDPAEMNKILANYGNLVYEKCDGYGYVNIGGQKIMVSHFPQHLLPDTMLPPREFQTCQPGKACLLETLTRGLYPSADTEFEIFGHTHRFGSYIDATSHKVVINVGTLHPTKKVLSEPSGYAIYSPDEHRIQMYDAESGSLVKTILLAK